MNDLFVNNDSNDSSSNNFILTTLFTHFTFSITVSDVTVCQNERQFKNFKKNVKVLIIISLIIKSLTQFITELTYLLKRRSLN